MNDALPLHFDPAGLIVLNAIIAAMVFGASSRANIAATRALFEEYFGAITLNPKG